MYLSSQFGNVLVLAATSKSTVPWLSELIPQELLLQYLDRTIMFLQNIELASKTAAEDLRILRELKVRLGFSDAYDDYNVDRSFST